MERLDDHALLGAGEDAGPGGFERVLPALRAAVLGYFMRQVGDPELAADLTAETVPAALMSVRRYKAERDTAAPWLFGIARHTLLRSVEKQRVEDRARRKLGGRP